MAFKKPTIEDIFKQWNACSQNGRWKTHRSLTPDIKAAVKYNLSKGWTLQDMIDAIPNFAKVVQGKDYKWTYDKWTLAQFLTRGKQDGDLRWVWFHPNNFRASEWLTKEAVKKNIEKKRARKEFEELSPAEKEARRIFYERIERRKALNQLKD